MSAKRKSANSSEFAHKDLNKGQIRCNRRTKLLYMFLVDAVSVVITFSVLI